MSAVAIILCLHRLFRLLQYVTVTQMHLQMLVLKPYELWWPVGYGKQTMYTFTIELIPDEITSDSHCSSSCHEAKAQQDIDDGEDALLLGCLHSPQHQGRDLLNSDFGDKCSDVAQGTGTDSNWCCASHSKDCKRSDCPKEAFSHDDESKHERQDQDSSCMLDAANYDKCQCNGSPQQQSSGFPNASHDDGACSSTSKPATGGASACHCSSSSSAQPAQRCSLNQGSHSHDQDTHSPSQQAGRGRASADGESSGAHWGGEHAMVLQRRVGLREVELRREKLPDGETFEFVVNGVPVYAKGELDTMCQ